MPEIYHPGTQGRVMVAEESVWHYRQSGWILYSEWLEAQAEQAAREAEQAAAAEKAEKAARSPAAAGRPVSGDKKE
jgi:hypothetical protein